MVNFPKVIKSDAAAKILLTTPGKVETEIEEGRLKGFKIDNEYRTTEEALLEFIQPPQQPEGRMASSSGRNDQPKVVEADGWQFPDKWKKTESFSFHWPELQETYDTGFEGRVQNQDQQRTFRIGFTNREIGPKAEKEKRRRSVVFWGDRTNLLPVVEFVAVDDFDQSGKMLSIIKLPDMKHLRPGDNIPEEYKGFKVVVYRDLITVKYASRSMAVVVDKNDLASMVRHALIRIFWKGWE
jgi:hypothetical protein